MPSKDIENLLEALESLNPEDIPKVLSLLEKKKESEQPKSYGEDDVKQLQESYDSFLQNHDFKKGELVKWKRGLKNRKFPEENQPAIVTELLDEPIINSESNSGTPYFREPLNIALGIIDRDGDFLIFHYDKRRFEPYR
jgi:hypothetical protein